MNQKTTSFTFMPIEIVEDNRNRKEGLAFVDNNGIVTNKNEALNIINQLNLFYNIASTDEWIEEYNLKVEFYRYSFEFDKENKVYLFLEPRYETRKPKLKTAYKWGFSCAWCGAKWSSKSKEIYYRAYFEPPGFPGIKQGKTVCSEDCARHISFELQKQWIHENGFGKFFKRE